jgi:CBS domain containing-hemolysin-like protein
MDKTSNKKYHCLHTVRIKKMMPNIKSYNDLKRSIALLEQKQSSECSDILNHMSNTMENLMPEKIIQNRSINESQNIFTTDLLPNTISGLFFGYLIKKAIIPISNTPKKALVFTLLVSSISYVIVNHPEKAKEAGHVVFNFFKRITGTSPKEA